MKLNLGCGVHTIDGWMNIDLIDHANVYKHDLSKGLPKNIKTESVDFIFTEHFIEHITKDQALCLLKDCYKVMRGNAVIRVSTPDLRTLVLDYMNGRKDRWSPGWSPNSLCDLVNEGMRFWGHQYLYDFEELEGLMKTAGFKFIRKQEHKISTNKELSNLEVRPYHFDLIIEGVK